MFAVHATPIWGVTPTPTLNCSRELEIFLTFHVILSLLPQDASYNLQKIYTGAAIITVKADKILYRYNEYNSKKKYHFMKCILRQNRDTNDYI